MKTTRYVIVMKFLIDSLIVLHTKPIVKRARVDALKEAGTDLTCQVRGMGRPF